MSWAEAAGKIASAGGVLRRGFNRRTDIVVIGHGAHALLAGGRLDRRLALATRPRARLVSEDTLLRALGLRPALAAVDRPFVLDQIAAQTHLPAATVRTLALFDVIEADAEGRAAFRDLVAARNVAKRLSEGATLADVLAAVHRRRGRHRRVTNENDEVARIGGFLADGQLRLPLSDAGNTTPDDLFEAAYIAEEDGALATAESLYRKCLVAERRDPTAAFNLANVLAAQQRVAEARVYYERTLAIDALFVEARYNLAHLLDAAGETTAAKVQLTAALKTDPDYADALFNLATLYGREGDVTAAMACWERYLALDPSGPWAEKARQALALCRRLARVEEQGLA